MSIFTSIASAFSGPIGGIALTILPYVVGAGAVGGMYLYAHHKGYVEAQDLCKAGSLQSTIDSKNLQIQNLKNQISDSKKVLADVQSQKQQTIVKTQVVTKIIHDQVKDNAACDVPDDVVTALNKLRDTK